MVLMFEIRTDAVGEQIKLVPSQQIEKTDCRAGNAYEPNDQMSELIAVEVEMGLS